MISKTGHAEAFVWIWLPGATIPTVAGRLSRDAAGDGIAFAYDRGYVARPDAISIYGPELPLRTASGPPRPGLSMAGCLRDAAPDAWGRRTIAHFLSRSGHDAVDPSSLDDLTCLLASGSDRIGALDVQRSSTVYEPRAAEAASPEELLEAFERLDRGLPVPPDLDHALLQGSCVGGARPKAVIQEGDTKFIAKFSAAGDVLDVVKAEFVAMRLAQAVGLDVAEVRIRRTAGRDVLLVRRFDRALAAEGWTRTPMVSALTIFGLDEMMARYASYEDLCTAIRHGFEHPTETLRELFGRLVFNVLVGNTDDHARNHAAFWDGGRLKLTPAYDICPQGRSGNEASQAMLIAGEDRRSQLAACRAAAASFLLSTAEADAIMAEQVGIVREAWDEVCTEAGLPAVDRAAMWRRQILNPYAFEGLPPHLASLAD